MSRRDAEGVGAFLAQRPSLAVASFVIAGWALVAGIAPLVGPGNPIAQEFPLLNPPGPGHWFGTDEVGRDVLSRVAFGARLSIPIGLALVACSAAVGIVIGGLAGFFGGALDAVLMRIADVVFAFPGIVLAMAVAATLGPSLANAVIALTIVSWPAYARLARSLVIAFSVSDFVVASRLLGASSLRALAIEIGPNLAGPVVVYAVVDVGRAILLIAALSFLGLGARPPAPEWGAMISAATQNPSDWWLSVFPGLAIFTVVAAFNMAGDEIRRVLDPRSASVAAVAR